MAGPDDLDGVVAGQGSRLGTGGMRSKLSSALLAADAGVPVLLAAAADAGAALTDASVGTVFAPRPDRMSARRFWVRYAAEAAGVLTLDAGAVRAVVKQRRSLLAAGITDVAGRFFGGDVVELRGPGRGDGGPGRGGLRRRRADHDDRAVDLGPYRPKCVVPRCTPTIWWLFSARCEPGQLVGQQRQHRGTSAVHRDRREVVAAGDAAVTIAIGMPSAAACRTNRYPENTVSEDPATNRASDPSIIE